MHATDIVGAEYWASFWEWIGDKAFILVVVALAVEYITGRWAKPHREALENSLKLQIAQLTRDAAQASARQKEAELQLQQMRLPRSLDTEKFEAAVRKISPAAAYEVLYDANAPDASFLASLIWGVLFNAKWPTQQTTGATPLRAPPPNVLPWANEPWTVAAGGGPWGLSVVTREPPDFEKNPRGAALVQALLASVKGPPSPVTHGYQTPEPPPPGGVRIIIGPKLP